jgi:hypothetical protein
MEKSRIQNIEDRRQHGKARGQRSEVRRHGNQNLRTSQVGIGYWNNDKGQRSNHRDNHSSRKHPG